MTHLKRGNKARKNVVDFNAYRKEILKRAQHGDSYENMCEAFLEGKVTAIELGAYFSLGG